MHPNIGHCRFSNGTQVAIPEAPHLTPCKMKLFIRDDQDQVADFTGKGCSQQLIGSQLYQAAHPGL